jgi:hypothetical protein
MTGGNRPQLVCDSRYARRSQVSRKNASGEDIQGYAKHEGEPGSSPFVTFCFVRVRKSFTRLTRRTAKAV